MRIFTGLGLQLRSALAQRMAQVIPAALLAVGGCGRDPLWLVSDRGGAPSPGVAADGGAGAASGNGFVVPSDAAPFDQHPTVRDPGVPQPVQLVYPCAAGASPPSATALAFGNLAIGRKATPVTVRYRHPACGLTAPLPLKIDMWASDGAQFPIVAQRGCQTVPVENCEVDVSFAPTSSGLKHGNLVFNTERGWVGIPITGVGLATLP